jgi:hypothetical protein
MNTALGHLGYCTNIHPGERWDEHFAELRRRVPLVKAAVSPDAPLGLGLRIAGQASTDLLDPERLCELQKWLEKSGCYVFTINGFPYGGFHQTRVKDQVHAPDWTQPERLDYTLRLFRILDALLPAGEAGGLSTSPLSYRHWWSTPEALRTATTQGTEHLLDVVETLVQTRRETGRLLHLDIEPEPDGILENTREFIDWYLGYLLPLGTDRLHARFGMNAAEAGDALRQHVQLCWDVCHGAVAYEVPTEVLHRLSVEGIRVGKLQLSSALRVDFSTQAEEKYRQLAAFDEPGYLHQVVARTAEGTYRQYPDLPEALAAQASDEPEWRVHFHVPLFLETYGLLGSTQRTLREVLALQRQSPFTAQLEVETYTWGVLPADAQVPIEESIAREIQWVNEFSV